MGKYTPVVVFIDPVSYNNDCKNYSDKCVHVQMKTTDVNTKSTFQICRFSTQCIHITLGYTWLCTGLVVGLYFYKTSYKPVLLDNRDCDLVYYNALNIQ
jgi:hypothetical protein